MLLIGALLLNIGIYNYDSEFLAQKISNTFKNIFDYKKTSA